MTDLAGDELRWLRALAEHRYRRNLRTLARVEPKGVQSTAEVAAVRAKYAANIAWQREVLDHLDALIDMPTWHDGSALSCPICRGPNDHGDECAIR